MCAWCFACLFSAGEDMPDPEECKQTIAEESETGSADDRH